MARLILALLAGFPIIAGESASIQFTTVPKAEIERRLNAFEDTNFKRELRLRSLFEEAGCSGDNLTEQRVKQAKAPNLICTMPGADASEIIVGGHFDFVDRGRGVVDNWSGSSLLPSLFQSLKGTGRRHTFVFIGFTAEEDGLVGSKFYVHELDKDARHNIMAMVNLDSLGLTPTKVELDRADKKLAAALGVISAKLKLPLSVVNVHQVGLSDSDAFQDAKVPAICIHSVTTETFPILHSPRDQLATMHLDDYYDTYLLVRAYLAYLDEILPAL